VKILLILIFLVFSSFGSSTTIKERENVEKSNSKNIWIKTYQNFKNYNILINNISKIELKIKDSQNDNTQLEKLNTRHTLYKSKLELYDKNNNFDTILRKFIFIIPNITLRDFIFQTSNNLLNKNIEKYITFKNSFYLAKATIQNNYDSLYNKHPNGEKLKYIKDDLEYFKEYTENIEKTYQNLLETREELNKRYREYKDEIFFKHIITLSIILVSYIVYKLISTLIFYIKQNKENVEEQKNYKKLLSVLFVFFILIFVIARYIDDLIYFITFLSVVAAALTLAMREILLNIAGAIYIFFSSVIKVGDRVMVQFETKHTVGDIIDISLVKIKLNELEDYTNLKEIKSVGRTIYIPNSYIFTKVFYNYSLKKNGIINELIEFDFDSSSNFTVIEEITENIFTQVNISHTISFNLNNLKTGIIALISYQTNYKKASKNRSIISIKLLEAYKNTEHIKLKTARTMPAKVPEDE
jgi:small-conductance mechanosensitive channel